MRLLVATTALLAACAVAVAASANHIIKEEIDTIPAGWSQLTRACPHQTLELSVLVRQSNLAELEATLMAVSDPDSPKYGQHLSLDEVNALTAPQPQHVSQILHWLEQGGVSTDEITRTPNSDMMTVKCTVKQAETLLHAEYYEFEHKEMGQQLMRTLRYHVPSYLTDMIDVIGPTVRFPSTATIAKARKAPVSAVSSLKSVRKQHRVGGGAAKKVRDVDCSSTTPTCLRSQYSVNDYKASSSNTSVAVTGFLEQYISPTDLATFFSTYDPSNARTAQIVGDNNAASPGVEASLDIQYSLGVAPGVPGTFWYTSGRQPGSSDNEPFLVFLQKLSSFKSVPWVVSTSYGDNEPTVLIDYAKRVNAEFMKAGVRGISILFSSGDGGVAGGQASECTTFVPTYPAGSPYVTAVGGTTGFNPETAVSFSSGGFTNYWSRPSYQTDAVQAYITKFGASSLPAQGLWNATGRGFPDVAASGTNYPVFIGGFAMPVDGTSCSTPTFSGIVSLLNDVRFKQGKSSLGFLNPLFYKNAQAFTDITSGSNPGCGTNGFTATQGWDPVTGLGTPNFQKLSAVVSALP